MKHELNPIYESLLKRKSTRAFLPIPLSYELKDALFNAAFQAPTAGNQMMYTLIDVTDQTLKNRLAETCDHQGFIATAPFVCVFLADTQRWVDAYIEAGISPRKPGAGDILLAIEDAMIAAQNMVVAAESFGLGSCYIGDILENAEIHRELLKLDDYVLPISLLVIGYPSPAVETRKKPKRFNREFIVFENTYRRLSSEEIRSMFIQQSSKESYNFEYELEAFWKRKYESDFALEMNRSSEVLLKPFLSRTQSKQK